MPLLKHPDQCVAIIRDNEAEIGKRLEEKVQAFVAEHKGIPTKRWMSAAGFDIMMDVIFEEVCPEPTVGELEAHHHTKVLLSTMFGDLFRQLMNVQVIEVKDGKDDVKARFVLHPPEGER